MFEHSPPKTHAWHTSEQQQVRSYPSVCTIRSRVFSNTKD